MTDAARHEPEADAATSGRAATDAAAGETKTRPSLRPLAALRPYLARHPAMLAAAGISLVASALAMLAVPLALRRMVDYGFTAGDSALIDRYFLTLIAIGTLLAIAASTRFYCVNWLGERVVADLRSDVFRHISNLGPTFFDRTHSGEVMSRLTADTTQIKAAASTAISQALRNLIMLIGALAMMIVTSPQLSMLVLVAIPVIVLPLVGLGRIVRRLSREAQDSLAEASAYASENLGAVRTMQAFGHEATVTQRFAGAVERSFEAARARLKARAGLTALALFLTVTSIVGVLWVGSAAVIDGSLTGGRLGQFVLYAVFAAGALAELSEVWGEVSQAAGAAERLSELMAVKPEIHSPAAPVALPVPARGRIAFDDVTFCYPTRPDAPALDGISFTVEPGETVALVGPSGSGKSTIFNLLLRFYDPSRGLVRLDGVPIAEADLAELRARMALVPQELALFADTVIENIRYGNTGASDADVHRAAQAAQAAEFIERLPHGYATRLGERGIQLSGGQRQRIAIARAVLRNAPILLLDEATSALDAESEGLVQRALEDVMKDRTTLVIAHRLATVQKADRILVLDAGRIVEQGTHADLTRRGGVYQRLAALQFVDGAPASAQP